MKIRPETPADYVHTEDIRRRAWRIAYRGIMPEDLILAATEPNHPNPPRGPKFTPEMRASRVTLVAEDNDRILGFAAGGIPKDQTIPADCELWALYVDPDLQGKGTGKELLRAFQKEMSGRGHKKLAIFTLKGNLLAQDFYEKLGGERQPNERIFPFGGHELVEVGYSWNLCSS